MAKKIKKFHIALMAILTLCILNLLTACIDPAARDACLTTGEQCPQCDNVGRYCNQDDGTLGVYVCTAYGSQCQDPPGSGTGGNGHGGDGGAGHGGSGGGTPVANCADHYGQPCDNGTGTIQCSPDGKSEVCHHGETPGYNCAEDHSIGTVCNNGHGIIECKPDGTGTVCTCTDSTCTGGGPYNCQTDPKIAQHQTCSMGTGICQRSGVFICNPAGDGAQCSVSAGNPNPVDICGNGLDDNCDGATDEPTCSNGGSGSGGSSSSGGSSGSTSGSSGTSSGSSGTSSGSSGSSGSGGGGTGGGGHGGADCTYATNITVTVNSPNALFSLKNGSSTLYTDEPHTFTLTNNDRVGFRADAGLSVTVNTGDVNVWLANTPDAADNVQDLLDVLFCEQSNVTPNDPQHCTSAVFGNRDNPAYIAGVINDERCWEDPSDCGPFDNALPSTLFELGGGAIVTNAHSLSLSTPGERLYGVIRVPRHCP